LTVHIAHRRHPANRAQWGKSQETEGHVHETALELVAHLKGLAQGIARATDQCRGDRIKIV
jgi:hypothetical protein